MTKVLWWGESDYRLGWWVSNVDTKSVMPVMGPSHCTSSGGGLLEAMTKAQKTHPGLTLYRPYPHINLYNNTCWCGLVSPFGCTATEQVEMPGEVERSKTAV